MSIINDALKKAQHQRTGGPMDAAPMPGGGSGARGSQGMPTGLLVLLIAGAAVVVVISIVTTVYLVKRTPAPKVAIASPVVTPAAPVPTTAAPAQTPVTAPATSPAASPVISAPSPIIIAPVIVKAPPPPVELPPAPPPQVAEEAAAATTGAVPAPEPVVEGSLADRINTYVDKVHVTGIRTSESGSKVLMNDHVYRINDIVDRKLGLRLVKIAADSLTFADASGATYVKNF